MPVDILELSLVPTNNLSLAATNTPESIFNFSDYLATLALLLVVVMISDFRYRFRLSVQKFNLKVISFWVGLIIGLLILLIDFWSSNDFPFPLNLSANNIKAALGVIFLVFVFYLIFISFITFAKFTKANAKNFFSATGHFIHQGNVEKLIVIAEELTHSIGQIIEFSSKAPDGRNKSKDQKVEDEVAYASDIVLLIADKRFCKVIVDRVPAFALICIEEAQRHQSSGLPISTFARNIGQEFIRNTESSYYQEDSGFDTGFFGYTKPITNIIFGSYKFVEFCSSQSDSPIDTQYSEISNFNEKRMEGYVRASLAFLEDYLKETKGRARSYALNRMFSSMSNALTGIYRLDGATDDYWKSDEHARLDEVVKFIREAINLAEQHAQKPIHFRSREKYPNGFFDQIANLIFETILSVSKVTKPDWTCWSIQHNSVWGDIFDFDSSEAMSIVKLKVRRLLYEEIKRMDKFPNYKGASILAYCLNVLGVKVVDRHTGYQKEFFPINSFAVEWTKKNYRKLLKENPKVAEACLCGSVTYNEETGEIIKTYGSDLGMSKSHLKLKII